MSMLSVSLVGKKFSCNIQLKITAEKDGGGLELVLKAGEKCSNRPQAISNVTASLNITIQRGCNNYVTKCKEMLMFLQEQALPKTMNIIKVHMVNRETKSLAQKDESKLFSCIRPSKKDRERARERSTSRDRSSTRGYSSDSEQLYRHPHLAPSDSPSSRQSSKTDIIATPRMSRHRLKNAALLRDRKQREASRERNEVPEKPTKKQEPKTNTSKEIHLPVREGKHNKHKRYSVRSMETDFDSQGELIYDGGSESSLRTQVIEDNGKLGVQDTGSSRNAQSAKAEKVEVKTTSNGVTDSDMSVDSLECLDASKKQQETKKKKKRKVRKRVEEKCSSNEDLTSSTSVVSLIPSLALPEDFHDSSVEHSDNTTVRGNDKNLKTKSVVVESSPELCSNDLTNILSVTAQQIVDDIIRSALKKCGKTTPTISKKMDQFNDVQISEFSAQSGVRTDDDVIKTTPTAVDPKDITFELIRDKSLSDEAKVDQVLTANSKDTSSQKSDFSLATEIITMLTDDNCKSKLEEDFLSATDNKMDGELLKENTKKSDSQENNSFENKPDQVGTDDGVVLGTQRPAPNNSSHIQQDNSSHIKSADEAKSDNIEYENKPCPKIEKEFASIESSAAETPVLDDVDNSKNKTSLAPEKPNDEIDRISVSKEESLTLDCIAKSESRGEKSSRSHDVEMTEQYDKDLGVNTQPIKIYDTHMNITKRIITSVSQALHLQTHLSTSSLPTYLDPDVNLAYYNAPERGLEAFLDTGLTSNNQNALEEFKSQGSLGMRKEISKDKKRRTSLRDQKSHETFQRFVQSQQFVSSDASSFPVNDLPNDNYSSSSSISGVNTSYINTSGDDASPKSGYCYFAVGSEGTSENLQKFDQHSGSALGKGTEDHDRTTPVLEPGGRRRGERPKSSIYSRSLSDQNERKRWITSIHEPGMLGRSPSADTRSRTARNNKCMSCPALSEEDLVLEGLESHHKDVCNSLSQRTWVILRVHEMWKAKKPLEAMKMCMEMTGIMATDESSAEAISSSNILDTDTMNKDNALFLNILLQLPSSCSAWSLFMCNLLLPELKMFISTRRHTSHVDMACNILQVIVKKINGVILKVQTENKEKPDLLKECVTHLRDVSDRISQLLVARRGKIQTALTTEDPIALKPVLRELLSTIQALLRIYVD